jgi:hypothetical protein
MGVIPGGCSGRKFGSVRRGAAWATLQAGVPRSQTSTVVLLTSALTACGGSVVARAPGTDAGDGLDASFDACGGVDAATEAGVAVDSSVDASTITDSGADASVGSDSSVDTGTGLDASCSISCPAPGDAGLRPYEHPASGSIIGSSLSSQICNAGAWVEVEIYSSFPTMTYLAVENGTLTFDTPNDAQDGMFTALVQIPSPAPGTYTSPGSPNCGLAWLTYFLPVPQGVDCDGGAPPNCPPGCSTVCSGFGCDPCEPDQASVTYTAQGAGTCFDAVQAAIGSWSVTLTSVDLYPVDAGTTLQDPVLYVAHGTLSAQLVDEEPDGGSAPATLCLSF